MKRVLAAAVLVCFMPTANAQDKGKADVSHNAEYRARFFHQMNPGADENTQANDSNGGHRFKLDLNFKASEKLAAVATLIHAAEWGAADGTNIGTTSGATTTDQSENILFVNQAYGWWMTSDDMSFKVGRMNYQIADGTLMSINDWENSPYAFEGLLGNYEAEFGKFQLFLFQYREITNGGGHPSVGSTASADPEHNAYGLNFDLKTTPEWLKGLNVHVIKDVQDAKLAAAPAGLNVNGTDGQDMLRYGAMAKFAFSMVDLGLWYEANTGTYKWIDGTGTKTTADAAQSLMAAEVGFSLPNLMASRIFVKYHMDSGDSDTATGDVEGYDAYFTEQHCAAGCMDLFGFGNLTFINVGWTMKPSDMTDVGLGYWMFSKSEKDGATTTASSVTNGTRGAALGAGGNADKDDLGSEIDLWATHKYDANLSTTLRLGHFMAGDVYSANNGKDDAITEIMLEGKMNF